MIKLRREAIDEQRKVARELRLKALGALRHIDPEDLAPMEVARFAELAVKIEKSIFEEFASQATASSASSPDQVVDIAAWSPAERRKRMELLRDELVNRTRRAVDDDEVVA
jgi:hypothetical protein